MSRPIITDPADREALLGLWAVPGLGTAQLQLLWQHTRGNLRALAPLEVSAWVEDSPLKPEAIRMLMGAQSLEQLAGWVRARAKERKMRISFEGDPDYPQRLLDIPDRPPLLFHWGQQGAPRSRAALVGSRQPGYGFADQARAFSRTLAQAGLGIVSGGAMGVDDACHRGALDAGGETWAFVACSLDRLDRKQWLLAEPVLRAGGMVLTEYPPNTPSAPQNFPRRNRLISGAADVVVVMRAKRGSGTLHTATHARKQGRPLLAVPGEHWLEVTQGCHDLLRSGQARFCGGPEDVFTAIGFVPERMAERPPPGRSLDGLGLSGGATRAFEVLRNDPQVFEEILGRVRMEPAALLSALSELELSGVAVQHPGKAYVKA